MTFQYSSLGKVFSLLQVSVLTVALLSGVVFPLTAGAVDAIPQDSVSITATKIICDNETDLPNWGTGGDPITANTATNFLGLHPNCHPQSGWFFEWGNQDTTNAGDTLVGPAGNGYTTFGPTDVSGAASTVVSLEGNYEFHLREVLQNGFIPFTQSSTNSNVSAEFYCANDVVNYNNYDFVSDPIGGTSYNCVAFNAPAIVVPVDVCANLEDAQASTPEGYELVGDQCNLIVVSPQCSDGIDNDNDGLNDQNDPGCYSTFNVHDTGSYSASDNDETNVPETSTASSGAGNGGGNGGGGVISGPLAVGSAGGPAAGSVLGASTSILPELPASCTALLHTYMRMGKKNDADEVKKLQNFLNTYMSTKLTVDVVFSSSTDAVVREFQVKHTPEVLTPWKINQSTGYVYKTTQRWINLLNCSTLVIPMPALN